MFVALAIVLVVMVDGTDNVPEDEALEGLADDGAGVPTRVDMVSLMVAVTADEAVPLADVEPSC